MRLIALKLAGFSPLLELDHELAKLTSILDVLKQTVNSFEVVNAGDRSRDYGSDVLG